MEKLVNLIENKIEVKEQTMGGNTINSIERLRIKKFGDFRGGLDKIYENLMNGSESFNRPIKEVYVSSSKQNVVRGLHFQQGNAAQEKFIYCLTGEFLDVSVNLEIGKNFGEVHVEHMSAEQDFMLKIPGSYAHGIISLADETTYINMSPDPYIPSAEAGIHWSSLDLNLGEIQPILTDKDNAWPELSTVLKALSK